MKHRSGIVYVDDQSAGLIEETADGFSFSYQPSYLGLPGAQPVSLTLPLRTSPYVSRTLFAFFAGLLAEGTLAEIHCRTQKIDELDLFGRLLVTCHETIGAVTVRAIPASAEAAS